MINKVMNLLNKQEEARVGLANEMVSTINQAKEALLLLGQEQLIGELFNNKSSERVIVKEVEVKVEDTETIAKLQEELNSKEAMYKGLIANLNNKINSLEATLHKYESLTKQESEVAISNDVVEEVKPVVVNNGLNITHKNKNCVIGTYNNIPFEASIRIDATTIYSPNEWAIKEELNKALIDAGYIQANRDDKDFARVECEQGSCHEIAPNKFMGYVVVDGKLFNYVFDKNYKGGKGTPSYVSTTKYLHDSNERFNPCRITAINNAIGDLIAKHGNNKQSLTEEHSDDVYAFLGLTTNNADSEVACDLVSTPFVANTTAVSGNTTPLSDDDLFSYENMFYM